MFSMDGPTSISIAVAASVAFSGFTLKLTRHGTAVSRSGNTLTFTMRTAQKPVLRIPV